MDFLGSSQEYCLDRISFIGIYYCILTFLLLNAYFVMYRNKKRSIPLKVSCQNTLN